MVEYNTGETVWNFLHGAVAEMPQLTDLFMKDNNLNYTVCGYKDNPELYEEDAKVSQYDDYKRHEEDTIKYAEQQSLIHDNLNSKSYVVHLVQAADEENEEQDAVVANEINNNSLLDQSVKLVALDNVIDNQNNNNDDTNTNEEDKGTLTNDIVAEVNETNIVVEHNTTNIEIETNSNNDTTVDPNKTNELEESTIETNANNETEVRTVETNETEVTFNNKEPDHGNDMDNEKTD